MYPAELRGSTLLCRMATPAAIQWIPAGRGGRKGRVVDARAHDAVGRARDSYSGHGTGWNELQSPGTIKEEGGSRSCHQWNLWLAKAPQLFRFLLVGFGHTAHNGQLGVSGRICRRTLEVLQPSDPE